MCVCVRARAIHPSTLTFIGNTTLILKRHQKRVATTYEKAYVLATRIIHSNKTGEERLLV